MTPILENIIFRLAQLEAHHILVGAFVETADYRSDFSFFQDKRTDRIVVPKVLQNFGKLPDYRSDFSFFQDKRTDRIVVPKVLQNFGKLPFGHLEEQN